MTAVNPRASLRKCLDDRVLRALEIDPWERDLVLASLEPEAEAGEDWKSLLVEAVGLIAKSDDDVEKADNEAIKLDAAIGFAIAEDMRRAIGELETAGADECVENLTRFQARLTGRIAGFRDHIGAVGLLEAEELSRKLGAEVLDTESLLKLEQELVRSELEQKKFFLNVKKRVRAERKVKRKVPRLPILGATLGVLIVVWAATTGWKLIGRETLPVFDFGDFQQYPAVRSVKARPPSLYFRLDSDMWNRMSVADRQRVISEIATAIEPAGYLGARFAGSDGRTVAEWLRDSGVRLVTPVDNENQGT